MSNFDWGYPNTVWFGNSRIKDLPKACKILDIKKPLFVTDQDLVKSKMVQETIEINKKANLPTIIFSDLKGNPLGSQVKKGVDVFKNGLKNYILNDLAAEVYCGRAFCCDCFPNQEIQLIKSTVFSNSEFVCL